jgi:hypothetical protein
MRAAKEKQKSHITCSSGTDPITTPSLAAPNVVSVRKVSVVHQDQFICLGAVDLAKLLRACRATLFNNAENLGANVLVEEQWSAKISTAKHRNDGVFRVHIRYSASAARSEKCDSRRPVALDQAKGIPGLMTILERIG